MGGEILMGDWVGSRLAKEIELWRRGGEGGRDVAQMDLNEV